MVQEWQVRKAETWNVKLRNGYNVMQVFQIIMVPYLRIILLAYKQLLKFIRALQLKHLP